MAEGRTITIVQKGRTCTPKDITVYPCIGGDCHTDQPGSATEFWFGYETDEEIEYEGISMKGSFHFQIVVNGIYTPFEIPIGFDLKTGEKSWASSKTYLNCSVLPSAGSDPWSCCSPYQYGWDDEGSTCTTSCYNLKIGAVRVAMGQSPDHPITYPNFHLDDEGLS